MNTQFGSLTGDDPNSHREQFRLLFETMQQAVVYQDAAGQVLSANPATERILGEPAADLIERTLSDRWLHATREDESPFGSGELPWEVALASGREIRNVVIGIYNARREESRFVEVSAVPLFRPGESKPYQLYSIFEDVTDRKRDEHALRESEARLRLTTEATGIGTFEFYPKTGRLVWSEVTKRHFGMAPETEINHDMFLAAVHPEDRERVRQKGIDMANRERGGRFATEFRTVGLQDGQHRWLAVRGQMLFDRENRATRMIGTTLDITESKHLEEKLRRRVEELQKLMDIAPVALLMAHDPDCHRITGNRAANAMLESEEGANLSVTPKEGTLQPWQFLRDGVPIPPEESPLQVACATGIEVQDSEVEVLLPSGAKKFIWGRATPLRDASGQVRGGVGAFQDVTATRRRAEAALRESEERFRHAADAAPIMMWCGDPQKRITFVNKYKAAFTGLSTEQLVAGGCWDTIHPDDLETAVRAYHEAVDKRASCHLEYRVRRADGEYRDMVGTISPRYIGDVYAGQVGTALDITELKRRQEQDIARQKLESLGRLASGIAHDFNNLLGGILSQAELASAELAEGLSPESEMANIRAVAIRGAEIVRQLMVYAGQEAEDLELVDVSRLVEETMVLLKLVVSSSANLRVRLGEDVPAVRANPAMLRQILLNLVTNASQAIDNQGGLIEVSTARVESNSNMSAPIDGLAAGEYLQLEVFDTGCGMTPEIQGRIFDPFFTTKSQGRGLGLPVVHGIVRGLGGEIMVRSRPRQGTSFQILLPGAGKCPAQSQDHIAQPGDNRPAIRPTVLIVEDEEVLRLAVAMMLKKDGFTVLEAEGGAEALEILRAHADDITAMLLDATLPGIPSSDVLREAKRLRPDLRLILTSAFPERDAAAIFGNPGSQPFLRKPYRRADLLKLLGS